MKLGSNVTRGFRWHIYPLGMIDLLQSCSQKWRKWWNIKSSWRQFSINNSFDKDDFARGETPNFDICNYIALIGVSFLNGNNYTHIKQLKTSLYCFFVRAHCWTQIELLWKMHWIFCDMHLANEQKTKNQQNVLTTSIRSTIYYYSRVMVDVLSSTNGNIYVFVVFALNPFRNKWQ